MELTLDRSLQLSGNLPTKRLLLKSISCNCVSKPLSELDSQDPLMLGFSRARSSWHRIQQGCKAELRWCCQARSMLQQEFLTAHTLYNHDTTDLVRPFASATTGTSSIKPNQWWADTHEVVYSQASSPQPHCCSSIPIATTLNNCISAQERYCGCS